MSCFDAQIYKPVFILLSQMFIQHSLDPFHKHNSPMCSVSHLLKPSCQSSSVLSVPVRLTHSSTTVTALNHRNVTLQSLGYPLYSFSQFTWPLTTRINFKAETWVEAQLHKPQLSPYTCQIGMRTENKVLQHFFTAEKLTTASQLSIRFGWWVLWGENRDTVDEIYLT